MGVYRKLHAVTDERTRSHAYGDVSDATKPRVVAFWEGGAVTREIAPGERVVIGRGDEANLQVLDKSVSRLHAAVTLGDAGATAVVEDLKSSNGVRVNGELIRGRRELAQGDVIEIGAVVVVVHTMSPAAPLAHESPMEVTRKLARLVAKSRLSVLIIGETGSGKEVLAESIHAQSPRASGPFVRINCAAFTDTLLESELFGHERGAFTGAHTAKVGLIESAHGGSLFLDEIGEMPQPTQVKLLRVLENREVRPVGALKSTPVDVRFIAATHRDLDALVAQGAFRADLHFRLNGVTIKVPPLRARRDEITDLAKVFLGSVPWTRVTPAARTAIGGYAWPGNIRELRNVIERAVLLSDGGPIDVVHLQLREGSSEGQDPGGALPAALEQLERDRIVAALAQTHGNQTEAAKLLGIARRTLVNRLTAYDLRRPRSK
jgi:transcriptional regulator with PAS, ATPase and Fis domain